MSPKRATLILGVLGWRHADLRRKMNRFARTKYKSGDVWKWFNGMRGVPLPVAVFLRLSLRIARLSRRLDHAGHALDAARRPAGRRAAAVTCHQLPLMPVPGLAAALTIVAIDICLLAGPRSVAAKLSRRNAARRLLHPRTV